MTRESCDRVRDHLPELISGRLERADAVEVEAHLAVCEGCREEAEVLAVLARARPEAPSGLEGRIKTRVREEFGHREKPAGVIPLRRRFQRTPAWALSAAALVVLALGTTALWDRNGQDLVQDPIVVANQEPLPEAWLWDDGIVAGAPVFDGLTEEDLLALLEEFGG
jgi:hypothetical protein